ncbi:MAG: phage tail tube protein [Planctomycetota bacterium]
MGKRIGGTISVAVDGKRILAKGEFEWNRGVPKRTTVTGVDGVHGFTEEQQPAMTKGTMTVSDPDEQEEILHAENATVTIDLNNGRSVVQRAAHFAGDGTVKTNEGEMEVEFHSDQLDVL